MLNVGITGFDRRAVSDRAKFDVDSGRQLSRSPDIPLSTR